jgi:hypothetical protein
LEDGDIFDHLPPDTGLAEAEHRQLSDTNLFETLLALEHVALEIVLELRRDFPQQIAENQLFAP